MNKINLQSGRSMIEMLGVLAIIGVLSVGGIMGYSKAMMRYKINKTIEQITYIAGNVRTTFANQRNYGGITSRDIWKKAHIFPEDMWKDGVTYPQNVWDGNVEIYPVRKNSADTNDNKAFYIEYEEIPEEACIELITQDWKNAQVKTVGVQKGKTVSHFIPPAKLDDAVELCGDDFGDFGSNLFFFFDIDTSADPWKSYLDGTA